MTEQSTFEIEGSKEYTVCSCGHQSQSVEFTITPNIIGEIEITVVVYLNGILLNDKYSSDLLPYKLF